MKSLFLTIIVYSLLTIPIVALAQESAGANENKIFPQDLEMLIGDWEGTLTYIDYSSGNPFKMPANLKMEKGKNDYELKLYNIFPNEPKANDESKLVISKDGNLINGKPINSRKIASNNEIEFIVEYSGKDGNENKKAKIRQIYIIGNNKFINIKEIRFLDQKEWIKRNEFNYTKK